MLSNISGFILFINSKSCKFSCGNNIFSTPAFFPPSILISKPPIACISPFKLISPVSAILLFTGILHNRDIIAKVIAPPAEGPSLGVAASGQCICIPCCFGRPRELSKEAIQQGWSVEERDKKLFFKNKAGKLVDKNQVPRQSYDGSNDVDLMDKPEGEGPGGAGPSFDRDSKGNIILSTIKGTQQLRELPAGARIASFNDCNETSTHKT